MDWLLSTHIKDLESLNEELDRWNGERLLTTASRLLEVFIGANFTGCIETESSILEQISDVFAPFKNVSRKALSFDYNRPVKYAR
ncbi:unnamed protein product [Toxocara canis]|nr:unnamed protein product [Toxocara canis]